MNTRNLEGSAGTRTNQYMLTITKLKLETERFLTLRGMKSWDKKSSKGGNRGTYPGFRWSVISMMPMKGLADPQGPF